MVAHKYEPHLTHQEVVGFRMSLSVKRKIKGKAATSPNAYKKHATLENLGSAQILSAPTQVSSNFQQLGQMIPLPIEEVAVMAVNESRRMQNQDEQLADGEEVTAATLK